MTTLKAKVILNIKTAAEWANSMEILLEGELGIESDTRLIKVGNGVDTFISLPYTAVSDISGIDGITVTNPADGQVLTYSNGEWVNITPSALPADTDLSHYDNSTSGFITASDIPALPADTDLSQYDNITSDFATVSQIPTDVSQLNNDAGYITSASIPSVGDGTITIQKNSVNIDSFTTNQSGNTTINITVPTLLSELSNDVGYITSATLPTVNDATLTIQRNGTTVGTFTANAATNSTINISVPTSFSDITSAGDLLPSIDATYNLGSPSYRWSTGYIDTIESTSINTANVKITGSLTVGIPSDVSAYKRITIKGYDGNTEGTLTDWAWLGWVNTGVFGFRPTTSGTGTIGTTNCFWSKGYFNNLCATDIYSKYNPFTHLSSAGLYYNTHVIEETPAVQWGTMGQKSASEIGIFPEIDDTYLGSSTSYWGYAYVNNIYTTSLLPITGSDISSYGNIIPNAASTYTLGDSTHSFKQINIDPNDTTKSFLQVGGSGQLQLFLNYENGRTPNYAFYPANNNVVCLGTSSIRWKTLYTNNTVDVSDRRAKNNIEDLIDGLEKLNTISVKSFVLNGHDEGIIYGFVAQDELKRNPELVVVPDDYSEEDGGGELMYMPNNVLFLAVKAIQELSSKVDELNAKIKVLEAKL